MTSFTSLATWSNWYILLTSMFSECRGLAWYIPVPLWGLATRWCAPQPWCCPEVCAGCVSTTEHVGDRCCCCSPQLRGYWAYWNLYSSGHFAQSNYLSRWEWNMWVGMPSHTAKLLSLAYYFANIIHVAYWLFFSNFEKYSGPLIFFPLFCKLFRKDYDATVVVKYLASIFLAVLVR